MCRWSVPLIFTIAVVALTIIPSFGAFWNVEPVYTGGFVAGDASLALDGSNVPSVSYAANGTLYRSRKTVGGWDRETVAEVGYWGGWSSLALNSSGQPSIAFIDSSGTSNLLKYGYKSSGSWVVETVDDVGWLQDYVSLAFDPSGQACIAYCGTVGTYPTTHTYVYFARRMGVNTWSREVVAEVGDVTGPSLIIDSHASAYLAFTDSLSGQIKVATKSGTGGWQVRTVDGSPASPAVWYTSVALDANGSPAVAYFRTASGVVQLRLAREADAWVSEECASIPGGLACYCSLGFTSESTPLIAYYDTGSTNLNNAWKFGGTWFTEVVDGSPDTGLRPGVKIDSLGNVDLSYVDNSNGFIKFACGMVPMSFERAKMAADGTMVQMSGVVASVNGGEMGPRVYVQAPDRSSGIQLTFTGAAPPVARGMLLDVQGQMTTIDGERAISDPDLAQMGLSPGPKSLGLANSGVGGGDFHYSPGPPAVGQKGVVGGVGLNNIGLLVSTWGRVKVKGTDYFTVDDGSGVLLKCYGPVDALPAVDSYVGVTGISSCEDAGGSLVRVLRVRDASELRTQNAELDRSLYHVSGSDARSTISGGFRSVFCISTQVPSLLVAR